MVRILGVILLALSTCAFGGVLSEAKPNLQYPYRGIPLPNRWNVLHDQYDVALYEGKGVWDMGREHLKMFFMEHGFSFHIITALEIRSGHLSKFPPKILVVPGGESWQYLAELGPEGGEAIRTFVRAGGGYIGICAGAFYATSMRQGGYATGPYGIGLLQGTAYDGTALKTDPFIEGMMDFPLTPHRITDGLPKQLRIVMFGGPSLRYDRYEAIDKGVRVLARFQKIDEPAMIVFHYGQGRVFLSAPHLEIEEQRTTLGPAYFDPESDWPLLENVVNYLKDTTRENDDESRDEVGLTLLSRYGG